jgi:thiazole synthase ThiGH ThiG subunit
MLGKLLGLPRWAQAGLAALAIGGGALLWLKLHDWAVVKADREVAMAKAATIAREADQAAYQSIETTQTEVEHTNAQARNAAARSDDFLGGAFDSLRAEKAGAGSPSR